MGDGDLPYLFNSLRPKETIRRHNRMAIQPIPPQASPNFGTPTSSFLSYVRLKIVISTLHSIRAQSSQPAMQLVQCLQVLASAYGSLETIG